MTAGGRHGIPTSDRPVVTRSVLALSFANIGIDLTTGVLVISLAWFISPSGLTLGDCRYRRFVCAWHARRLDNSKPGNAALTT